jgi:hypothetical protein
MHNESSVEEEVKAAGISLGTEQGYRNRRSRSQEEEGKEKRRWLKGEEQKS